MIISRARKFIFVHIPKTGGTALSLALEARAAKDDILIGDTPKARARKGRLAGVKAAGRIWKHSTLSDVVGVVTEAEVASFFTVTLVRNPWDRMVSYYHWLRVQAFAHAAVGLAKSHDFNGFLHHPQTRTSIRLWPYGAYMRDARGVERASLYVRLEHLETDIVPFEAHLGFRVTPLARVNVSERPPDWRAAYSDADAALVDDLCADDIARFGYGFDDGGVAG
jgi:Sulfotransferase family